MVVASVVFLAGGFCAGGDKKDDKDQLQGEWTAVSVEGGPIKWTEEDVKKTKLVFKDDNYLLTLRGRDQKFSFKIDPSKGRTGSRARASTRSMVTSSQFAGRSGRTRTDQKSSNPATLSGFRSISAQRRSEHRRTIRFSRPAGHDGFSFVTALRPRWLLSLIVRYHVFTRVSEVVQVSIR